MLVLLSRRVFGAITRFACRFRPMRGKESALCSFQDSTRRVLDPASLLVSIPLGIISWGLEALVLTVVAASLGYSLPVSSSLLAHAAGTIAGAISMIPGGLGLTEVTIDVLIEPSLGSASVATVVTILMRFATLWFAVGIGLAALGIWKAGCAARARSR
jgi:uncharacterized protein (TIRG00374 family)